MSGVGVALGVAPSAFKTVIAAWKIIDDCLSFDDDAQDLAIRLERAKGLLTIWASQSGLSEGALLPALRVLDENIARTLERISGLISDLQQDGRKYGLATTDATRGAERRTAATVIMQMRRSLRAIVHTPWTSSALAQLLDDEASKQISNRSDKVGPAPRLYWALRDKHKFMILVESLEEHIDGLVQLLRQTQIKDMQQQLTRLDLQVVQGLYEAKALAQLQALSPRQPDISDMDVASLAEWKALTLEGATSAGHAQPVVESWGLGSTDRAVRSRSRFVRRGGADPDMLYLFEKKEYDTNISDTDKDALQDRIRRLFSLLGGDGARRQLHTLRAVGYVDDPELHCWWMIFRYPVATGIPEDLDKREPLSLNKLLASSNNKPALETRYKLAQRLAHTFSRLYGSAWMHKSVNSVNIIFPHLLSGESLSVFTALNTALVQGFGYSRQHTEAQTIDRGRVHNDLEAAIYRHPNYQGEAASGYQLHYDIYSLGLVLFEIALWSPLMAILAAKPVPGREPPVQLSPKMDHFHEIEARELKRRVDMRVETELAYRVGTKFKVAVQWCLGLTGPVTATEFYDMVVVPLEELSSCS